MQENFTSEIENILQMGNQENKLNLDDIIESIKNLKNNSNIADELKNAIKILKRMKLNECCKW